MKKHFTYVNTFLLKLSQDRDIKFIFQKPIANKIHNGDTLQGREQSKYTCFNHYHVGHGLEGLI